jgi:hypothetical protein
MHTGLVSVLRDRCTKYIIYLSGNKFKLTMNKLSNNDVQVLTRDVSSALQNAVHFFQGRHDKLPDLLKDAGSLLMMASRRLSAKQIIIPVSILAIGAIVWVAVNANQAELEAQESVH